jgi:hypothetical protein
MRQLGVKSRWALRGFWVECGHTARKGVRRGLHAKGLAQTCSSVGPKASMGAFLQPWASSRVARAPGRCWKPSSQALVLVVAIVLASACCCWASTGYDTSQGEKVSPCVIFGIRTCTVRARMEGTRPTPRCTPLPLLAHLPTPHMRLLARP